MVVSKQLFQKWILTHYMISVSLLLILVGGVFITSHLFVEVQNTPKEYYVLISLSLLLIGCVIPRGGIKKLTESLKSRLLLNGIVVICLLTTIHGLLQYVGVITSNHSAFPITGTFENPAGFAAVQAALFPFVLTRCFDNEKSMLYFSTAVSTLCFVSVILSGSRTGILAICSATVVVLALTNKVSSFFKAHRWLLVPIIVVATVSLVSLYYAKQDSADGRVFIWSRCFDMIMERPLLGYGVNGFHSSYMNVQADFFQHNPDSQFVMLADNVVHPFNEYIKLTINFGFVGATIAVALLVFIVCGLLKSDGQDKKLGLSFVASLFIMCQFSYPFRYVSVWMLTFLAILPAFIKPVRKNLRTPLFARIVLGLSFVAVLFFSLKSMYYEMKWCEISKRSLIGQADRMIKYYDSMKSTMKRSPLFLYNYAAELHMLGKYEESIDILSQVQVMWNDYDVQLLQGSTYSALKEHDKAIEAFDQAYNMIPCRFEPLYGIILEYKAKNDTVNVIHIANEIIEKPIKIRSNRVSLIIELAQQSLSDYE